MKIVVNACFGGFSLSQTAEVWLFKKGASFMKRMPVAEYYAFHKYDGEKLERRKLDYRQELATFKRGGTGMFHTLFDGDDHVLFSEYRDDNARTDPLLIQCIEEMGVDANGSCAELKVIEIPDDVEWQVDEHDGLESIHEKHRSWS